VIGHRFLFGYHPRNTLLKGSEHMAEKKGTSSEKTLYCSFCGKSQHEVKKLIAGPSVFVCDECIELCNEIIRDELPPPRAKTARATCQPQRKSRPISTIT
jgi:hypothetical protein